MSVFTRVIIRETRDVDPSLRWGDVVTYAPSHRQGGEGQPPQQAPRMKLRTCG